VNRSLAKEEVEILSVPNITAQQIIESTLAIPAFVPATVCTGYVAAWFTNLHNFRQRSLVERIFWSLPLSFAVTPIASYLIGKFISLTAVVAFLLASAIVCAATLFWEGRQIRRLHEKWNIGWNPLGGKALASAVAWMAITVLSLADIESNHKLFMNVAMSDQSARINWIESVLHTGVPPVNPLYMDVHPAPMRNYYFWYVICATVGQMAHIPARAVLAASCVWSGFVLAALSGLYLKHFLCVGARLRTQFLCIIGLSVVSGLDICAVLWNLFFFHKLPPTDLDLWSRDPIFSWLNTLYWAPHHIASLLCCMLAFLLAWNARKKGEPNHAISVALIAFALASAFGLSVYVTFAFFLVLLVWAPWQIFVLHSPRPAMLLAAGGVGAGLMLIPYLRELAGASSGMHSGDAFGFAVREMVPPGGFLTSSLLQPLSASHPLLALNIAKIALLPLGYSLELGFYLVVLLVYLVPTWRGHASLTLEQRSLVFVAVATLPFVTFIRSGVLTFNDFGFRGVLLLQFSLLILASELFTGWRFTERQDHSADDSASSCRITPRWLRSIAALALVLGVTSLAFQALWSRFVTSMAEWRASGVYDPKARSFSHNAYISSFGYAQLDAAIPNDAVVQFNPKQREPFWIAADQIGVNHQTAIASDQPWCGSEIGGDPRPCPAMAAAIDALYEGVSAEQAQATCRRYGIQYLIARIYDPAWGDKDGWVWTLKPVVLQDEFRALDCGH
jgi:hypothetical protein